MAKELTLAEEYDRLNAAIVVAHQAIKDLKAERGLARELFAEARREFDSTAEALIRAMINPELERLSESFDRAVTEGVEKADEIILGYLETALNLDREAVREGRIPLPDKVHMLKVVALMAETDDEIPFRLVAKTGPNGRPKVSRI